MRILAGQSLRNGCYGGRTRKGIFWCLFKDSECGIKLNNSKRDPFCWHRLSIITEKVFGLVINIVRLPPHMQESENVCQVSYLAPFCSLGIFNSDYYLSLLLMCICCYFGKEAASSGPAVIGRQVC